MGSRFLSPILMAVVLAAAPGAAAAEYPVKAIRIVEVRQPVKLRRGGHIRLAALVQSARESEQL